MRTNAHPIFVFSHHQRKKTEAIRDSEGVLPCFYVRITRVFCDVLVLNAVNKNLTGTGLMTADQKKKLLWGSKKNTTTDEPSHRWDSAMFSDRERQEKFNKLMGVKGEVKVTSNPATSQDSEKLQVDLEKQYTAGLRRRDGRTVGLGL